MHKSDEQGQLLTTIVKAMGGSKPVLQSVNHFYNVRIPQILNAYKLSTVEGLVATFNNSFIVKPTINDMKSGGKPRTLWPYEARRNGLSYTCQLFAKLQLNHNMNGRLIPIPDQIIDVCLGKLPAILQSEVCHLYGLTNEERYAKGEPEFDPGAYAIIKGNEKVLLNIENLRTSEAFLYEDKEEFTVRYTSQSLTDTTVNIIKEDRDDIHVTFSKMGISTNSINVFYIFYVLGFTTDTVERVFETMDMFIIDEDPVREARRRKDMRYYMQPTVNTFMTQTEGKQEQIYNILSGKIHDKNINTSSNRNDLMMDLIWRELFKNVTLNYRDITELNPSHMDGLLPILATKIRMLTSMVVKYVDFKNGYRKADDRDYWGNKQLIDAGKHLTKAFARVWKLMTTNTQNKITSNRLTTVVQIKNAINQNYMTEQFINSYNKELFSTIKGQKETAIVDTLKRDNIISAIAHIRRISTPTNRRAKIREKRLIHNTQYFFVCPIMASEGENCGLVKDTAVTVYVSLDRDDSVIKARLEGRKLISGAKIIGNSLDVNGKQYTMPKGNVVQTNEGVVIETGPAYSLMPTASRRNALWLNGIHLGFCNSTTLREKLLHLRRTRQLYFDTGIVLDQYNELKIFTNEGRLTRPVLIVDKDTQKLVIDIKNLRGADFETLMNEGAIEYIDAVEQEQIHILIAEDIKKVEARKKELSIAIENSRLHPNNIKFQQILEQEQRRVKYTHCEIDPTAMLGLSALSMPFTEYNPAPRCCYQSGMLRQALAGNSTRIELRFDTTVKTIVEPGVPSITTDGHSLLGLDQYPGGRELIVAVSTYGGSNQEDAITFNQAAFDMGLFLMMIYHSYKTTVAQSTKHQEKVRMPIIDVDYPKNQIDRYSKLDPETGIVRVGEFVKSGDCLVGKFVTSTGHNKNDSLYVEVGKEGVVDEVYITENAENCKLIRIRLRELRKAQTGDKFASRYSQKGTAGDILPEEIMPFIVSDNPHLDGVRPHIIFSPHGIPSRMTIGKMYELYVGKYTAITGERFNATAFREFGKPGEHENIYNIKEEFERMGFNRNGKEKLVNGVTGREMDADIYVGTAYYQVLRHLVKDKMQARGTGTLQFLTRQPTAGIRKDGGLRLGEMERDALLDYGASYLQQERMSISSDAYPAIICKTCNMFAWTNMELAIQVCRKCKNGVFTRVVIPYAFKLLTNYLNAAGMRVKLQTKEI